MPTPITSHRPDHRRTRAVAYVRVSSSRQADEGVSIEAQRDKLRAYADLYDLDLVSVEQDDITGETMRRPGLQRALDLLRSGAVDALVVVKLDRLTRNLRDLLDLVEEFFRDGRPWTLLSVGDQIDTRTASGRLVVNMLGVVGQWERETISERTRAALAWKKSNGEKCGGPVPYGKRLAADGLHLEPEPLESEVVACAMRLRSEGLTLREVLAGVERELGARQRNGRRFLLSQIARMVRARREAA